LLCLAIAAISNLAIVVPFRDFGQLSEETLYSIHYDYPLQSYIAAAGVAILLVLGIWSLTARPPTHIYRRFRKLDSNALDTDRALCQEFYLCALQYRSSHGSQKYRRYFINHFDFFYEFHNFALKWIDEILTALPGKHIPQDFMLHAISTGQIGQVFTDVHYASGLPVTGLHANDPLIYHARADVIEVWSYNVHRPLCKVRKNSVKLQNAHQHPQYLTVIFTGIDQSGSSHHQIEIRFLTLDQRSHKSSSQIAIQRITRFKEWLKEVSRNRTSNANDYGIDVSEILRSSRSYETPVTRRLTRIEGKSVNAVFTRATLPISDKKIPLDAVVLCEGIGIVTINERAESGDISFSGDPIWYQYIGDDVREVMNPCMHAKLARSALGNLLNGYNLISWPIISLIVYSSPNVTLNQTIGKQRLQCDVIKLESLDKWFAENRQNATIRFTEQDLKLFHSVLSGETVITEPELQFATV
jgi:hypothetical protein